MNSGTSQPIVLAIYNYLFHYILSHKNIIKIDIKCNVLKQTFSFSNTTHVRTELLLIVNLIPIPIEAVLSYYKNEINKHGEIRV